MLFIPVQQPAQNDRNRSVKDLLFELKSTGSNRLVSGQKHF